MLPGPGAPRSQADVDTRLRVLHVITRLELGGAQRNTLYTVAHLDRTAFAAALAWGPGDRLDGEAAAAAHVERFPVPDLVRPVAPGRDRRALAGLRAAVRRFGPDVVHTHSSKAGVLGRCAAHLEQVPVVVHSIHGFGFTPNQPVHRRALFFAAERLASAWTDHFVAVCHANARRGVELGLFPPEGVTVIRSGIDLARFRGTTRSDATRQRLGIPEGVPVATQIGNFKPQKAPLDFVRVAAAVAAALEDVRFVMAGDGPLRPRAEDLAAKLGVADRIVFCGWWDDVPALLAASDLCVLTSRHEGLPRAVVESLASGVPVVATAVDGTPEVVHHGVNGLLAPAGDVTALAAAVARVLADRRLRDRLAHAARRGLDEFDIEAMVRQQEELYRCLVSNR